MNSGKSIPPPRVKRVLVVDDEVGMRVTLAANLELLGYEVVEAEDGERAVALFG